MQRHTDLTLIGSKPTIIPSRHLYADLIFRTKIAKAIRHRLKLAQTLRKIYKKRQLQTKCFHFLEENYRIPRDFIQVRSRKANFHFI